jgi:TPP-dependent 2-oxoacid decarboxylase
LERLLADSEVQDGKGFKMIEVIMTREDAPESLKKLVQTVQKRNSGVPDAKVEGDKAAAKAAAQ